MPALPAARRRLLAEGDAPSVSQELPPAAAQADPVFAFAVEEGPIVVPELDELEMFATAVEGGPIIIPEEGLGEASSPAAASAPAASASEQQREEGVDGSGEEVAASGASNDCREVGWLVERVPFSREAPLAPADLAGAQLAARRARQQSGRK